MIDLSEFEKKKITKPSDELCVADVGALVKVITRDGVEISDVLSQLEVSHNGEETFIIVRFQHVSGSFRLNLGMRTVVQRPEE